jgi:hypothetical protein
MGGVTNPPSVVNNVNDPMILVNALGNGAIATNTNTPLFPSLPVNQTTILRQSSLFNYSKALDPGTFTLPAGHVFEFMLRLSIQAPAGGDNALVSIQPNFGGAFNQGFQTQTQPKVSVTTAAANQQFDVVMTWLWYRASANENGNSPYLFIQSGNAVNYTLGAGTTTFWVKLLV